MGKKLCFLWITSVPRIVNSKWQIYEKFITCVKIWHVSELVTIVPSHIVGKICVALILFNKVDDSCLELSSSGEFNTKSTTWKAYVKLNPSVPRWGYGFGN